MLADLNRGFTPPLYVTGHSQGGAVAALATKLFAASVNTPVVRLEFGDDSVPHVPLHGLPLPVEMALKATTELKDVFGNISTTVGYVAIGTLTYGAPGRPLRVDVSPADEKALTVKRLSRCRKQEKPVRTPCVTHYIGMLS